MKKDETLIQDEIIKFLDEVTETPHWRISGATNMGGFPDILACYRGIFVALEVKTAKGKTTRQQEQVMAKINAGGGWAYAVRSVPEVMDILKRIDRQIKSGIIFDGAQASWLL